MKHYVQEFKISLLFTVKICGHVVIEGLSGDHASITHCLHVALHDGKAGCRGTEGGSVLCSCSIKTRFLEV